MSEIFEYLIYSCVGFVIIFLIRLIWNWRRTIWCVIVTIPRDLTLIYTGFCKCLVAWLWKYFKGETIFMALDRNCKSRKDRMRPCFFYEDEIWTMEQVQSMSFQVANYFQDLGYRKGDVVGLAMQNRPEVICIWLGLSRLGVITALINFNLCGDSLEHCIDAANCKSVIFGSELREAFKEIWSQQQGKEPRAHIVLYELDRYLDPSKTSKPILTNLNSDEREDLSFEGSPVINLAECLKITNADPTVLGKNDEPPKFFDTFLYIFTSGTTGMPKPVKCVHSRQHVLGLVIYLLRLRSTDICYNPLPLYHTFASSAVLWALSYAIPMVIIPKFSATKFWSDIHRYKATTCLYMGELCRFIVNQPIQPELERTHSLRVMYGCGVKQEVWEEFKQRFNISKFTECYGSTEGNCTLVNMEATQVGAVGYVPIWFRPFYSVRIIKVDEVTGELARDKKTGFCIPCKDGEPGELVGRIVNFFPSLRYDGYTNKDANEKKIAYNVFRKGDTFFRSGDLMSTDEYGYLYFKDRIGDTFRWKGENVSTAEVEGLILRLTDMKTTVVYGVKIPRTEGSAGMAVIVDPDGTLDLKKLAEGLEKGLPAYARPIFLRITRGDNSVNMTGTFKLPKINLQKEGFNIDQIPDPIYIYVPAQHNYQQLDIETYRQIMLGNYRF